ncbi:hypothetical protein GALMADRAFT_101124 [Galerina marginata CBS 339.88]|uniref:F-box domain-containing protein n=1 Tax=Galerina marginata (strain CBS 339.88) TaxID=685588 RepID=A0A067SRX0_GALM3|nr:hypothetical protein GALMADRAFT_101124 [Galerina marginata CBS 339.88]
MEIVSYFKALPIPMTLVYGHYLPSDYLERTDTLRALSQTCRLWRNTFFPLLWQRLETCATHSQSGAWYQVFGESLIRKSFLVTENPEIAAHVRSMSVILSRYSTSTVLPAFIRAIEALPSLTTLQILSAHHKMTTSLKKAFEGHVFPQVKTVVVPSYAHNILRSCPEVKRVICINHDASKLVSAIAKECKKVEELEGFYGNESSMKRLAKATPNLRSIKFTVFMPAAHLQPLTTLKHVSHITLISNCELEDAALKHPQNSASIKLAKDIIRKSEGRKSLVLEYKAWNYSQASYIQWSRNISIDT